MHKHCAVFLPASFASTSANFAAVIALSLMMHASVAQALQIVSPSANASTEDPYANGYPFNLGAFALPSIRYQQVYDASQFASIASPMWITQIAFRPDGNPADGGTFDITLPSIQINMSTTSAASDAMSATFSSNVGANDIVVFPQGPLALSSAYTGPVNGPKDFDIVINLITPFLYDPSAGNLLLDVRNFSGGQSTFFEAALNFGDHGSRVFSSSAGLGGATGLSDTGALITRFTFVPEPSAFILAAIGLAGLAARGWRRRMC